MFFLAAPAAALLLMAGRSSSNNGPSSDTQAATAFEDGMYLTSGATTFQGDHPLKNAAGSRTSSWAAGEAVSDRFPMVPPAGHPGGGYPLRLGLYTHAPMKVLQITRFLPMPADGWKDHAILLAQVECK
jgi:hypothetical protein